MTTITYRAGMMAADTQVSGKSFIYPERSTKIHRCGDVIWGSAGEYAATMRFYRWMMERGKFEDPPQDMLDGHESLVVRQDGLVITINNNTWSTVDGPYYAFGSGYRDAYVAMYCGLSAPEAVQVAMRFDPRSGGDIEFIRLKSTQPAKLWAKGFSFSDEAYAQSLRPSHRAPQDKHIEARPRRGSTRSCRA